MCDLPYLNQSPLIFLYFHHQLNRERGNTALGEEEVLPVDLIPERTNTEQLSKQLCGALNSPLVRELSSLDHEESIFFLEHLQVRNARATLRSDVTGRELSALKSAAEFKALGIKLDHDCLALIIENAIKSYAKSDLQQSIIDQRRIMYAKKLARQQGVSPLVIAYEEEDHDFFSILLKEEEWEDINVPVTVIY